MIPLPHNVNSTGGQLSNTNKQRMKSATMNKRIQRGFSRENDNDGYNDDQNYHGYQGHLSNTDMPPVNQHAQY